MSNKAHPEYTVWSSMRDRCNRPANSNYHNYGGRGIKVCQRWGRFRNFLADMGPRPSPEHEIDRIDNDGDYEPDNCRWATRAEQARNMRTNRLLTVDGETLTVTDWAARVGVDANCIFRRLYDGRSPEEAIAPHTLERRRPRVTCRGERKGAARMTDAMVALAREQHAAGKAIRAIARDMGIGGTTMFKAIHGETWTHVPMPSVLLERDE